MGSSFFDQFSLLHFAAGVVAYFWSTPLWVWMLLHTLFEVVENSPPGMEFINAYLGAWWPGGKSRADEVVNSVGDTAFAAIGWAAARGLDAFYKAR